MSPSFLKAWSSKFFHRMQKKQLAHCGGKYSIERMLALEEYTKRTSVFRVLLVMVGVPLIVFALVIGQEIVPLQDPAEGWKSNYGFWVRSVFVGTVVANACAIQIGFWLDVPPLSTRQILVYCICVGFTITGSGAMVADIWTFPVPFYFQSLSMITTGALVGYLRLVVGARAFWCIAAQRAQLSQLGNISSLQATMCFIYPVYQVVFNKVAQTPYELPVLLVLPGFKFAMKAIFASLASHREDMVPAQVVFTVEFFDAFYFATFMPSLSSATLAAVMMFDVVDTLIELRELHGRMKKITACLSNIVTNGKATDQGNLLTAARSLCSGPDTLRSHMNPNIRLGSCIFHRLSLESRSLLTMFEGEFVRAPGRSYAHQGSLSKVHVSPRTTPSTSAPAATSSRNMVAIQSFPLQGKATKGKSASDPKQLRKASPVQQGVASSSILQDTLEVLFTSECLVLSEYVEVFIPLFYASFALAMVHLPSAQYHIEMAGITHENVGDIVSRIFLYALLEFVSLVLLVIVMKRNCGLNALYQLAFVLETQLSFILATLMLWIFFTLTLRVSHFGVDFSFRFEWVK